MKNPAPWGVVPAPQSDAVAQKLIVALRPIEEKSPAQAKWRRRERGLADRMIESRIGDAIEPVALSPRAQRPVRV